MSVARPVVVGSFVLGGLAIAVIAIVFFGGFQLFARQLPVVVVFRDSIAGLEVGAPVTFRGVRVGRVEDMKLHIDTHHHISWVPVQLNLNLDRVSWANGSVGTREDLEGAVNAGLRAQLVSQGLVSGQMSINLDYHPGTPAVLADHDGRTVEIPTISSEMQNLKNEFEHLDLPALVARTQQTLAGMQRLVDDLDKKIGPLTDTLQSSLTTTTASIQALEHGAAKTFADIDRLAIEGRSQLKTNGQDLDQLLKSADVAANQADALVASLNDLTSDRSDLQASLRDLAASASSLRSLTHDLERNPVGTMLRHEKP